MWIIRTLAIVSFLASMGHKFWSFSLYDLEQVPDAMVNPGAAMVNWAMRHKNNEMGFLGLPLLAGLQLSEVLNMIGNYVLIVPVLMALRRWLRSSTPAPSPTAAGTVSLLLIDVATVCGAIYLTTGGLGAAILARLLPLSVSKYATITSPAEMRSLENLHSFGVEMVFHSFWGCFETIFAALMYFCIAARLILYSPSSSRMPFFAFLTLVLAMANKLLFVIECGKYAIPAAVYDAIFMPALATQQLAAPVWVLIAAFKIPRTRSSSIPAVSQERAKKD